MFKDNLKYWRKINKLSQQQLAAILNVSFKTISHWENGYSEPSLIFLNKIKQALNISYEDLLD